MSNISILRNDFESTNWKRAFASRLLQLRPEMNPDAADEASDAAFIRFREVEPGIAAVQWNERQFPRAAQDPSVSNG